MKNNYRNLLIYCLMFIIMAYSNITYSESTIDPYLIGQSNVFIGDDKAVPKSVLDKIKAEKAQSVFSVGGLKKYDKQILKVDQIVFQEKGVLELTTLDKPWIAVVAKRAKFNTPQVRSSIRRQLIIESGAGSVGGAGSNGNSYDRSGNNRGGGSHGGHGGPGGTGTTGKTQSLPEVYILFGTVETQAGSPDPKRIDMEVYFGGISGGRGGVGGRGGNGGNGQRGLEAAAYAIGCKRGPGTGGNGGNAGPGGRGGDGGNGGDGSDIHFGGNSTVLGIMSYFDVRNEGGQGGSGGNPGARGSAGLHGIAGRPDLPNCQPRDGRIGRNGYIPTPSDLGPGKTSVIVGRRGTITLNDIDVPALF